MSDVDKQYAELFQIGITSEILGVKMTIKPDVALNVGITDFDRARIGYDKMNVYEREVWNKAIEEAAKVAEFNMDETVPVKIRKLKK